MNYGLIGEHLSHSFSKEIHEKLGRYKYEICEVPREEFDSFMKKAKFKGINVTIPYKKEVIPYLKEIDDNAAAIGAVNTVVNTGSGLYGYNTDFGGMRSLIKNFCIPIKGNKVLILGTGGTSCTAYAVVKQLGASEILKVSRDPEKGITYDEAYRLHSDADVIINTTPVGMFPDIDSIPIDLERFENLSGVLDVIYNPLRTRLVMKARSMGISAIGGLGMLVRQAILSAEFFTGDKFDPEVTESIFLSTHKEKMNIVLTGMPRSGKSTVARHLAKRTGRPYFDSDKIITERTGLTSSEIFDKYGEEYFRDLETGVIKELSAMTGVIISTGGGAVLRKENIDTLKLNGKIFFLDRPLNELKPDSNRPTASTYDQIKKLYEERRPLYLHSADAIVKIFGTPRNTVNMVLQKFYI